MENWNICINFWNYSEQLFGAKISINLDTNKLKMYFGIFLLIIAATEIYTLFKKKK